MKIMEASGSRLPGQCGARLGEAGQPEAQPADEQAADQTADPVQDNTSNGHLMKLFSNSFSGHAELVEASLALRRNGSGETAEMLRPAQHDVLVDFSELLNSFTK